MGSLKNSAIRSFVRMKELRLWPEIQIENRFQREDYREKSMRSLLGCCGCGEWRSITKASVGMQCTGSFANMSGGKS